MWSYKMKGFKFAGINAGIKNNDLKDLGLVYCDQPATAAALFTKNMVVAAPVLLGKEKIRNGMCQAILVNSGNANCFTGDQGMEDAVQCSKILAEHLKILEDHTFISSTGVIGQPLPMDKFRTGIPKVVENLSQDGLENFAQAILTTDTHQKVIEESTKIAGKTFSIIGVAKGSGMIRPNMATMLAYIFTDVQISNEKFHKCLSNSNKKSFNRISVDGDTSTNDTLLALANGSSNVSIEDEESLSIFQTVLDKICFNLAKMIVKDGEGATKLIQIVVKGAKTSTDAFKACEAIAHSNLVKTAIYGEDPNWGRITAAAGRSGAYVDQNKMDLFFNDEPLVLQGVWLGSKIEKKIAAIMKNDEIIIILDLNLGKEKDRYIFCDFSEDYVKINAEYRS
jgi:glutamate N-acetyltransferase / amino-acid N-acetyltransferase